jgi:hypothetical protein
MNLTLERFGLQPESTIKIAKYIRSVSSASEGCVTDKYPALPRGGSWYQYQIITVNSLCRFRLSSEGQGGEK